MSGACRSQGKAEKELRSYLKYVVPTDPKKVGRLITKVVKEAQEKSSAPYKDDGK